MVPTCDARDVVAFWRAAGEDRWFTADDAFDAACREGFLDAHKAAARGDLAVWEESADGVLALAILLDQIPRNVFRGTKRAFATDPLALSLAEAAIGRGLDSAVEEALRIFVYMPFAHAEDLAAQDRSVALFSTVNAPDSLAAAHQHRDIIRRFGRFPHRNAILGRPSTPQEHAYLAGDDAFRG